MSQTTYVDLTCTQITPSCPVTHSIYGYYPSLGFNAFFVAFFALFALIHAFLGLKHHTYFFAYVLTVGCISEAIGYGGRIMLYNNPYDAVGFDMQISCLIFAPSFVAAGIYITLKHIVITFGAGTSLLRPELYTWIFISCDMVCLSLQAVGGGLAGSAGFDAAQREVGTNLMIAGIVAQVFTLLVFAGLVADYVIRTRRYWEQVPIAAKDMLREKKFRLFLVGVATAYMTVFTRCVYRIPELTEGWASEIMRDEASFIVLEGFMIVMAVLAFAVAHPGFCFPVLAGRTRDRAEGRRESFHMFCRGNGGEGRNGCQREGSGSASGKEGAVIRDEWW